MSSSSDHDELIAQIYAVAADPSKLLSLRPTLTQLADQGSLADAEARLSFHFDTADSILNRSGAGSGGGMAGPPAGRILLDGDLKLLEAPPTIAQARAGRALPESVWMPDRMTSDRAILRAIASKERDQAVISLFLAGDRDIATPHLARRGEGSPVMLELCPVPLRWDAASAANFAEAFALTPAEQAILREILERGNLRLLAQERAVSIGTVRNQLKRLLHKLELGSQGELIALYGGFRSLARRQGEASLPENTQHRAGSFLLDDIDVRVEFFGPAGGRPVLFFHPLLGGPFMPEDARTAYERAGLRLIAPWRPYCGREAGEGSGQDMVNAYARRMAALLDQLGIARAQVLAASGGTAFALAFAKSHPHLCERVVIAGPALPISTDEDLATLGIGHRLPLQLARRLPAAMRLYVRAVVAKIRKGLEANYLDTYFKDSPTDHAFAAKPENHRFLHDSSMALFADGFDAAIEELKLYAQDWSVMAEDIEVPVTILRGADDRLATEALARSFRQRYGFQLDEPIPGAGSFLIYQKPERVAEVLAS